MPEEQESQPGARLGFESLAESKKATRNKREHIVGRDNCPSASLKLETDGQLCLTWVADADAEKAVEVK